MAKEPQGTVHVMEEEMRSAKQGVFAPASELRATSTPVSVVHAADKPAAKEAPASPQTKMDAAPANKAAKPSIDAAATRPQRRKTSARKAR